MSWFTMTRCAESTTAALDGCTGQWNARLFRWRCDSGPCTKIPGHMRQQKPTGSSVTYTGCIAGLSFAPETMHWWFTETSESAYRTSGCSESGPGMRCCARSVTELTHERTDTAETAARTRATVRMVGVTSGGSG